MSPFRYFCCSILLGVVVLSTSNTLIASANTQPSIASIAEKSFSSGDHVRIRALASDADSDPLAFHWEQSSGDTIERLRGTETDSLSFSAPDVTRNTRYQFTLSVSDGQSNAQQIVSVMIKPAEELTVKSPVADAGKDQTVMSGDLVYLDGSSSHDEDSLALTFGWEQITGPTVTLLPTLAKTSFFAPSVVTDTTLTFKLNVSDGELQGNSETHVLVHPLLVPLSTVQSSPLPTSPSVASPTILPDLTFIDALPTAKAGDNISLKAPIIHNAKYFWRITNYPLVVSDSYSAETYLLIPQDFTVGKEINVDLTLYVGDAVLHKQHQILIVASDLVSPPKVVVPTISTSVVTSTATPLTQSIVPTATSQLSSATPLVSSMSAPVISSSAEGSIINTASSQPKLLVSVILVTVGLLCIFTAFYTSRKKIIITESSSISSYDQRK